MKGQPGAADPSVRARRPTCRARALPAIGLLTAGVALSACGSAATLSREQLVRRADAICLSVNRQASAAVASLTPSGTTDARQTFIRATETTLPLSDRGLAQLRALRAPPSLAEDWRRFLRDAQTEDGGEHELVRAARAGDLHRGESIQVAMQNAASDLQQVAVREGFSVCGRRQGG